MKNMQRIWSPRKAFTAMAAVGLIALAGCGGGGGSSDNGSPPTSGSSNMPPASASASVSGLIAYVKLLVANPSDNTEPLDVTAFNAPVDDMGEPDPSI